MNLRKSTAYATAVVLFAVLITALPSAARNKVIENPQFECRSSSITTIERIELSDTATTLHFHAIFRPHWWISIDSTAKITDPASGKEYLPVRAEGIKFGEQVWMPESGEHRFSITYPPLSDSVEKIDFKNDDGTTYGVSLEKSAPADKAETVKATETAYVPSDKGFFTPGTARLHGKILNYDRRTCPDVITTYIKKLPTGEDFPIAIQINNDGTFDREIPIPSPQTSMLKITNGCIMEIYLEQGNDLEMIVDWEDLLHADRMRGLVNQTSCVRFGGSLASINREIKDAPQRTYIDTYSLAEKLAPQEAKAKINQEIDKWKEAVDKYKSEVGISEKAGRLLDLGIIVNRGCRLLDYEMYRRFATNSDTIDEERLQPLPTEYFRDFMTDLMTQDTTLLSVSESNVLLNRIAFSGLNYRFLGPANELNPEMDILLKRLSSVTDSVKRLVDTASTPLVWQLAMCDRMIHQLETKAKAGNDSTAKKILSAAKAGAISDPALQSALDNYCDSLLSAKRYDLPDNEAGRIMRDIIEPHKGKMLVIDFWGTGCGPCRQNIESSREFRDKHRDHPDFKLIFVTGEDDSPRAAYDKYVDKNLQGETCHYLSASDISRLRELFRMSAIPRYILIDRDGKVANDNLNFYTLQGELMKEGVNL